MILTFRKLLTDIPNEKRERIKKFVKPDDTIRILLIDILVRSGVVNELEVNNKTIKFTANKYGKPFLREITYLF
jgi:4'-phosphopantetheinyl transferase